MNMWLKLNVLFVHSYCVYCCWYCCFIAPWGFQGRYFTVFGLSTFDPIPSFLLCSEGLKLQSIEDLADLWAKKRQVPRCHSDKLFVHFANPVRGIFPLWLKDNCIAYCRGQAPLSGVQTLFWGHLLICHLSTLSRRRVGKGSHFPHVSIGV